MKKLGSVLGAGAIVAVLAGTSVAGPRVSASGSLSMAGASSKLAAIPPAWGTKVVLDATYKGVKRTDTPRVQIICMQDGSVVYGDSAVLKDSPATVDFTLGIPGDGSGTSVWTSGGASCRSDLFYTSPNGSYTLLADVEFDATA